MKITERLNRNKIIAKYLCTAVTYTPQGIPVYPTYLDAATHFNMSISQIFKIKKELVGLDDGVERHLKEDLAPQDQSAPQPEEAPTQ